MPKNVFFMSFLYVFIVCAMFIVTTVHSAPTGEDSVHSAVVENLSNGIHAYRLHNAGSPWYRK